MRYYSSWRQHQAKQNARSLFSVFLTVVLLFAIISGLSKGILLSSKLHSSRWDSKSPIAVAIGAKNPSVFVYQPDTKKMTVLALDGGILYNSGKSDKPLKKISESAGVDPAKTLSEVFSAEIENFATFGGDSFDRGRAQKIFKSFASVATPFRILTTGYKSEVSQTNITRFDALRLWWQLKNLSLKNIDFVDVSSISSAILNESGQKVLGVDTAGLNREIGRYLENPSIAAESFDITIRNQSGSQESARLAAGFVKAVGGKIVNVESGSTTAPKTVITVYARSSTASYLAKMFNCDITTSQESLDQREIILELGLDFTDDYF